MALVLVGEDDRDVALLLEALLELAGYESVVRATGADVIASFEEHRPDAVVLDVALAGDMDGLDTTRRIRGLDGGATPILLLTARTAAQDRREGLAAGADSYVTKPFDVDDLLQELARLLAPGRPGRSTPSLEP